MKHEITVALVGARGYGAQYVNNILDSGAAHGVKLGAVVARNPQLVDRLADIEDAGAVIVPSVEALTEHSEIDLAILSSPIQLHLDHACTCLKAGFHVLCEKPAAATIQDCRKMAAASVAAERFLAIGYQWSFTQAVLDMKADVLKGRYGAPKRFKTLVFWPRSTSYFTRNDWAARLKSTSGAWILDSPVNNATAHFLHNMFFTAGEEMSRSAQPVDVQAELYRANEIENYDTACLRVQTDRKVEMLFYTSHAAGSEIGPLFCYEFEHGTVYYDWKAGGTILGRTADGELKAYGNPEAGHWEKIWSCAESIRSGRPVLCDIEAAIPQVLTVNGAQESMPAPAEFPDVRVKGRRDDGQDSLVWVEGLQAAFVQCYDQSLLCSEHGGIEWSRRGKPVDLRNYASFPANAL